jgi:hypothetical protein
MSLSTILNGKTTGNGVEVDASNNLQTTTPQVNQRLGGATPVPNSVGATRSFYENDAGGVTGTADLVSPRVSRNRRLRTGLDTLLFSDAFVASAQNTGLWTYRTTTLTTTWGGGYMTLNGGNSTAAGQTVNSSYQTFPLFNSSGLQVEIEGALTAIPPANFQMEVGIGFTATSAPYAPTDGAFFRVTSAGVFGVVNYNGSETTTGVLMAAANIVPNANVTYSIDIYADNCHFWGDGQLLGTLVVPSGNGTPFQSIAAPVFARLTQPGVAGTAIQLKISNISVVMLDINTNMPMPHQMAHAGLMAYQGQNGATMGSTALSTNNLAAGAGAAMTNTTAALGTGLGGQFSALPTLTVGTDGIICSYANTLGSVTSPPRSIVITGVRVQGAVTTALTGGPVVYEYALAFGHTAVSLATAEGTSSKAPRKIMLGFETYASAAAVGAIGTGVYMAFNSPIVVNPGEFVAIAAKNLGVVTTAGVITFNVAFDAYEV